MASETAAASAVLDVSGPGSVPLPPAGEALVVRATYHAPARAGLHTFYVQQIDQLDVLVRRKQRDLLRLRAQRNTLNHKVRGLYDELELLQRSPASIGSITKVLSGNRFMVKTTGSGKLLVGVDRQSTVDVQSLKVGARVALRPGSSYIFRTLPAFNDPLVALIKVEKSTVTTYDEIGGLDAQIAQVREVIELSIKHPELFEALGIDQPKGVLMYGPPGTGKTLVARAVAHHSQCQFIRVSGTELVQKYIGEGTRLIRELFAMARASGPSIIFMDEIDSISAKRIGGGSSGRGDSEVQRTMLELLNQLDGFEPTQRIKVLMATNRIDILDPALLRPGRIDRKIEFPNPNEASRMSILKIHSRRMNLQRGVDFRVLAGKLEDASGADCRAVCMEAGMFALRERRMHVTHEDFELAVAKVMKKDGDQDMSLSHLWK